MNIRIARHTALIGSFQLCPIVNSQPGGAVNQLLLRERRRKKALGGKYKRVFCNDTNLLLSIGKILLLMWQHGQHSCCMVIGPELGSQLLCAQNWFGKSKGWNYFTSLCPVNRVGQRGVVPSVCKTLASQRLFSTQSPISSYK